MAGVAYEKQTVTLNGDRNKVDEFGYLATYYQRATFEAPKYNEEGSVVGTETKFGKKLSYKAITIRKADVIAVAERFDKNASIKLASGDCIAVTLPVETVLKALGLQASKIATVKAE